MSVKATEMPPEDQQALNEMCKQAIARILYKEADKSQMTHLAEIEAMVRSQVQQHVTPELGVFLSQRLQQQQKATAEP